MMPTICVWEGCGWLWVVFGRGIDGCSGGIRVIRRSEILIWIVHQIFPSFTARMDFV